MSNETDVTVMDGLIGRALIGWSMQDDGMHFDLDDGRVVVIAGMFALAVFTPKSVVVH